MAAAVERAEAAAAAAARRAEQAETEPRRRTRVDAREDGGGFGAKATRRGASRGGGGDRHPRIHTRRRRSKGPIRHRRRNRRRSARRGRRGSESSVFESKSIFGIRGRRRLRVDIRGRRVRGGGCVSLPRRAGYPPCPRGRGEGCGDGDWYSRQPRRVQREPNRAARGTRRRRMRGGDWTTPRPSFRGGRRLSTTCAVCLEGLVALEVVSARGDDPGVTRRVTCLDCLHCYHSKCWESWTEARKPPGTRDVPRVQTIANHGVDATRKRDRGAGRFGSVGATSVYLGFRRIVPYVCSALRARTYRIYTAAREHTVSKPPRQNVFPSSLASLHPSPIPFRFPLSYARLPGWRRSPPSPPDVTTIVPAARFPGEDRG